MKYFSLLSSHFSVLRRLLVFTLVCLTSFLPIYAGWVPMVNHYTTDDYQAGTQNWSIVQQPNGWIYAANNYGLLEYDGAQWRLYGIWNSTAVRSVAVDSLGNIYAGGTDEVGLFTPNASGGLDYQSLVEHIPAHYRKFGEVWKIFCSNECLYVQTRNYIFLFDEQKHVQVIEPGDVIRTSLMVNNEFYVATSRGLYVLNANRLHALRGSEQLYNTTICAIVPLPQTDSEYKTHILIATDFDGIYSYDGEYVRRVRTQVDKYITENQLYTLAVSDNNIAFGTVRSGVVITDLNGNNAQFLTRDNALQNNTILSLCFDKQGNLWAGLDRGIDCILRKHPILQLNNRKVDYGAGYTSCDYDGKLYLGTNQGLYYMDNESSSNVFSNNEPKLVEASLGQVWDVRVVCGSLLCSHNRGLFEIRRNRLYPIETTDGVWSVRELKDGRAIAATYTGFMLLTRDANQWVAHRLSGFYETALYYEIDQMNNIWVLSSKGLEMLTIHSNNYSVTSQLVLKYPNAQQHYSLCKLNQNLILSNDTSLALLQPDGTLVPTTHTQHNLPFMARYVFIKQDKDGNRWLACNDNIYFQPISTLYNHEPQVINLMPYANFVIGGFANAFIQNDGTAILGGVEGFRKIEGGATYIKSVLTEKAPNLLYIRQVVTNSPNVATIYGESYNQNQQDIVLPANFYSIRVDLATNQLLNDDVMYQTRLYPVEKEFTNPSHSPFRYYTALQPGSYRLDIKLLVDNQIVERNLSIVIKQPWYKTTFANIFYGLFFVLLVVYSVYYIRKRIKQKQQRLEEEKNLQLHKQQMVILQLEHEKTQFELRQKSQELSNMLLTELNRKELSNNVLSDVRRAMDLINEGHLPEAKLRLQSLQNRLASDVNVSPDWKRFEENFDIVNNKFLAKIKELYPWMSKQERRLCVYIKMGLMTKEIAPLMNLSTRSVEMMRYRLRDKMQLDRQANLKQYFEQL